jgi:hypothetical protein
VTRKRRPPSWPLSPRPRQRGIPVSAVFGWFLNSAYQVPQWAVDRTPSPRLRVPPMVIAWAVAVVVVRQRWPHIEMKGVVVYLAATPYLLIGTWIALRAHQRIFPLEEFRAGYKNAIRNAWAARAGASLGQVSSGSTAVTGAWIARPLPTWFAYRVTCIFTPSVSVIIGFAMALLVLKAEHRPQAEEVLVLWWLGVTAFLVTLIAVVGLTGRPIFLLPKLLRDAHHAGGPLSEEAIAGPPVPTKQPKRSRRRRDR